MTSTKTVIEAGRERAKEGRMVGISAIDGFLTLGNNIGLLRALVGRDLNLRYRGSMLGIAWIFLVPAAMAMVYTYIFGFVLKSRFGEGGLGQTWLAIYLGTTIHQVFSEVALRSASLIHEQAAFVKKIAVPLRILPVVPVATSLVAGAAAFLAFFLIQAAAIGLPPATASILPLALLPFALFLAGIAWTIAAIAAYIRDLKHVVAFLATFLLFVTPVFYPLASVPESLRWLVMANPLTYAIEVSRSLCLGIPGPSLAWTSGYVCICLATFSAGYAIYRRIQDGFADVV